MRFIKTRTIMGETIQGDYIAYDPYTLPSLILAICPDAVCSEMDAGQQLSFDVFCKPEYEEAVRAVVKDHGSEASVKARIEAKEKAEHNAPLKETIASMESKTLRAMREQLINTAIAVPDLDKCTTVADVVAWLKANMALESWKENGTTKTIQTYDNEITTERGKMK